MRRTILTAAVLAATLAAGIASATVGGAPDAAPVPLPSEVRKPAGDGVARRAPGLRQREDAGLVFMVLLSEAARQGR